MDKEAQWEQHPLTDAGLASIETDFIEAQTRLVNALTRLRQAQRFHALLFGPNAYEEAVQRLSVALNPRPVDQT